MSDRPKGDGAPGVKKFKILAQIIGKMTPNVAEGLAAEIRHEARRVGAVATVKKTVIKTAKKAKKK